MKKLPDTAVFALPEGRFGLTFPYNDAYVAFIRGLADRRWNAEDKHWDIAMVHLPEVLSMLNLDLADLDKKLLRAYQMFRIRHGRARITADNLWARVSGVDLPHERIDRATSYFVPGYKQMTPFLETAWDGKRRLYDGDKFPAGLVSRIARTLRELGIECEIEWPEEPRAEKFPNGAGTGARARAQAGMRLRPFQREGLAKALQEKRGILEIATGGGKGVLIAHLVRQLSRSALIVVPTKELLHLETERLTEMLGMEIGRAGDGEVNVRAVTVATIQACADAFGVKLEFCPDGDTLPEDDRAEVSGLRALRDFAETVPLIIFDECQHLPTESAYAMAMEMRGAHWRYGLTANSNRADGLDLLMEAAFGPRIYAVCTSTLIRQRHLVPPKVQIVQAPAIQVRQSHNGYQETYNTYVVENRRRNKLIVQAALEEVARGRSVLVLVMRPAHGRILKRMLKAPLLDTTLSLRERHRILKAVREKKHSVLVADSFADEGLHLPVLDCVIVAGAGRSAARVLQRVSRVLRKAPGKKSATIVDFVDDAPYLREHASDRLELYKAEEEFRLENSSLTDPPGR